MRNLIYLLIAFTGIFFYPAESSSNIVHIPQKTFLMFSAGVLLSSIIWYYNKIIGAMSLIVSFVYIVTVLSESIPTVAVNESYLYAICVLVLYVSVRNLKFNDQELRWFLVPAIINILIVFLQKFLPDSIPLKSSEIATAGLLGSGGLTASFLGMTTPIFLKWFPIGLPFLLLSIFYCKGFIGFLCFFVACVIYLSQRNWMVLMLSFSVLVSMVAYMFMNHITLFQYRISAYLGTLDGIMHHKISGWGLGTFLYVMSQVQAGDSIYFHQPFNTLNAVLNHPHNEFLFGWWNFGLLFFVLSLYLVYSIIREYRGYNSLCFQILMCSFIVMMFYFLTPPTTFLTILAIGIYQNNIIKGDKNEI